MRTGGDSLALGGAGQGREQGLGEKGVLSGLRWAGSRLQEEDCVGPAWSLSPFHKY